MERKEFSSAEQRAKKKPKRQDSKLVGDRKKGIANVVSPTASNQRLGRGLPGYLILFATHAFVPQRQNKPSGLTSPLAFR